MKLKFKLPSWLGLALLTVFAAGLAGCSTTTEYTYTYTDVQGATVKDTFTTTATAEEYGFLGYLQTQTANVPAGTVLSDTALPYGATITMNGTVTEKTGRAENFMKAAALLCTMQACWNDGTSSKLEPNVQNCPAYTNHEASCKNTQEFPSYSATCPASCSGTQRPALVMGSNTTVSCQCATLTPPSCANSAALSKRNVDGTPAWDTCTPVELPKTTLANPNDPLLKQMMGTGTGACTRVYSLVLHKYVCQ